MSLITYHRWGNGPEVLVAFHGIGQSHQIYQSWAESLGTLYTIYAFDLPFHGANTHTSDEAFSKAQWQAQFKEFLTQQSIEDFSIVGFSMGGRFALATLEGFASRIRHVFLLAPDGIRESPYYTLAVRNTVSRSIFKYTIFHVSWLMKLAQWLGRVKLIHPSTMRFALWMLDSPEKRTRVYHSWIAFRHLRFSPHSLIHLLNQQAIPVQFFMGEFDRMMPPELVNHLCDQVPTASRIILRCGHNHLIQHTAEYLQRKKLQA
ncbi:alpha/beta fold hydrolase [Siphonobacter curvatus]|uniref:Alpha/beta hydrolase n=1 Tax=Siphonobacter curvatus TaxID=2094562 RepID=A0A2S7IKL8_9BACT|nr:alpha/beta hydrolase [Siphonobacter curvatus]PQA58168.1 alpha/beta hydrolase [Siphonobacter curvatus]